MKKTLAALSLLVASAAVLSLLRTDDVALRSSPTPAIGNDVMRDRGVPPTNSMLYAWGPGERRAYDLQLTSSASVASAAETEASLELDARFVVDVIGDHEDGVVVRYAFGPSTGRIRGVEDGAPYDQPMPQLDGQATYAVVGVDGRVDAWWVDRQTDLAAQQLLEQVVAEMQPRLDLGAQWTRTETTALGDAQARYEVQDAQVARVTIARIREEYVSLHLGPISPLAPATSEAEAVFEGGVLRSIAAAEVVHGSSAATGPFELAFTLQATLTGVSRAPVEEPVAALRQRLTHSNASLPVAERGALLARLRGMTPESMLEDLFVFGTDGNLPNAMEWMWRATALLTLQPELCADVVLFATDPEIGGEGHAFALQLLASVGHAEAQAAFRDVLSLPNVRADEDFDQLVQRGVLVPELDDETVRFYEELADSADADVNLTASNVLATAADQALERGDTARSAAIAERLVQGFEAASSPEEREARLRVLGNAADPSLAAPLLAASEASSPDLRGAAARGLRNQQGPEVAERLHTLALDEDLYVRRRALESMAARGMTAADWERLTPALAGGAFQRRDEIHLMRALRSTEPGSASREAALVAIAQLPSLSGRTMQQVEELRLGTRLASR